MDEYRFVEEWNRMRIACSGLREEAKDRPVSAEYRRSLMDDVEALESIRKDDLTTTQKLELCGLIASDLALSST